MVVLCECELRIRTLFFKLKFQWHFSFEMQIGTYISCNWCHWMKWKLLNSMASRRWRCVMSLITKLADWSPNYHKTARTFTQIFCNPHSMIKLTLNEPAMKSIKRYKIKSENLHCIVNKPLKTMHFRWFLWW